MIVRSAKFRRFPTAAFALVTVGLGLSFWSPLSAVQLALLGVVFGIFAIMLAKSSTDLDFDPPSALPAEKRRFLISGAFSSFVSGLILAPVLVYFLSEFRPVYYLAGLCSPLGVALLGLSRKFA